MAGKGFANDKPFPLALHCSGDNAAEFDRLFAAYQRQGLSKKDSLEMVGISSLMSSLREAGFSDGEDFGHSQQEGLWLSAAALQHIERSVPAETLSRWAETGQLGRRAQP